MDIWTVNSKLPQKAGKATIEWDITPTEYGNLENSTAPRRVGPRIRLPAYPTAVFYPLLGGKQFIFRYKLATARSYGSNSAATYFGGTDEEPFLVRLNDSIFSLFQREKEAGFFAALVPDRVKRICSAFGTGYQRQGDIFAAAIPFSIRELQCLIAYEKASSFSAVECGDYETISLFGTRHIFSGLAMDAASVFGSGAIAAQGKIEAPDHAPRTLPKLHILGQTADLFSPKLAD